VTTRNFPRHWPIRPPDTEAAMESLLRSSLRWSFTYDPEEDMLIAHPHTHQGPAPIDLVVFGGGDSPGIAVWRGRATRAPLLWMPVAEA
jgi:hypothetical protein